MATSPSLRKLDMEYVEWDIMGKTTILLTLNLSDQHLSQLPDQLFELNEIKALKLDKNKDIRLSEKLIRLTNLKALSLVECNLDTVPAVVMKLQQLETLILGWNRNITLPDEMSCLLNLTYLDLQSCDLTTVPAVVMKLSQLSGLCLFNNKNIKLPDEMSSFVNLTYLDLESCGLNTLPPVVLKLLNLQELDLSNNKQISLPDELCRLDNIKVLTLRYCNLATVPPAVLKLPQLEELDLGGNSGIHLPDELVGLTNIRVLKLWQIHVVTVPPVVWRLSQLEWLDLHENPLQSLTLPAEVGQLTNVKHLDLSHCQLRTLPPEVWRLTLLERLYLRDNQLQILPAEVGQLSCVIDLNVDGNPLLKPPVEVCRQGIAAIRQYFSELERSDQNVSARLKVVVLGEKMAGKTSLIRSLERGESTLTEKEDRTHCVEITRWAPDDNITFEVYDFGGHDVYHLTHQFFLTQGALNLLAVNLETYNCTAQSYTEAVGFWLDTLNARVPGAVVTIVGSKTDMLNREEIEEKSRDIQERFKQQQQTCLRTVQEQIKKLENIRAVKGGTDEEEVRQQLQRTRQLLTCPLRLTGVCCVSSAEPTSGLDTLRSHIVETTNNSELFPTLRIILPQTWVDFEQRLRDLRDGKLTKAEMEKERSTSFLYFSSNLEVECDKWLTRKECRQLAYGAGLETYRLAGLTKKDDRLEPVLSYLQQVGTILRYTDIPELKNYVFHDPAGLIDVIKELFHHDLKKSFINKNPRLKGFSNTKLKSIRKDLSNRGYLPREVVIALLGPHATPVGNVDVITNLMEHFGLCYTERSDEQDGETPTGYCIPWYIREERPEAINRDVTDQEETEFTVTCEITHFCPRGLFERLSVVVNKLIKSRQDWKDAVVAVREKLPITVYRETKDEYVKIVIKLTVPVQKETHEGRNVIGPLKEKLLKLLLEWPGLLYHLVWSENTLQSEQSGDQNEPTVSKLDLPCPVDQDFICESAIIPTFEVGPGGCTVQHGGATLEFPEGCVVQSRFISVEVEAFPVTDDIRTNFTAMSAVLTVEQDFPQRFLRPVTVRLPWVWTQPAVGKETTITAVLHYSRERWTVFQTDTHEVDGGIVFQTDHFQRYWVLEVLHNCGKDLVSWAQEKWNDYTEDKVYVIVTPKVNILPERTLHLICLSKEDNLRDFFESTDVTFASQVKQRVVLKQDQRVEASFGKDEDVGTDPRDLREGDFIELCPSTRRAVRLRVKESVPQKHYYVGKLQFTVRRQDGTAVGQQFEMFVRLREEDHPPQPPPEPKPIGPGVPIVLLLNDEYGTSKGGISTINCEVGQMLTKANAVVYATALRVPKQDQEAADRDGVKLIGPDLLGKKTEPTLDWLTYYHSIHYPHLPRGVTCIIGHADITDTAARNIWEQRYPQADLMTFNHVIPEDTEYYKGGRKAMKAWEKEKDMLDKADNAKAAFSVGKRIHDHFDTMYKGDKKPQSHHIFLPKPSEMFLAATVRPGGEQKVVLTAGRVRNVEKLKGHDLAAQAMGEVVKEVKNTRLRVRGISEEDWQTSLKILKDNLNSPDLNPTLLPYGTQKDIRDDMMTAHLVLMPSRSEPFGLVGLEAIAAGIPVLISDKTGLAGMINDLIDQGKLHPDRRHVIVETSVNDSNSAEDAKRWAGRIVDILKHSASEFEKAARFKRELVESRYWEESHRTFLQACGITAGAADQ